MKQLFTICLIVLGFAQFSTVAAQTTESTVKVTNKRELCVESRNEKIPMSTLGNIPANAKLVGNIVADPVYYCNSSSKTTTTTQQAPAAKPAPADVPQKMKKATRVRMVEPKR